MYKVHEPSGVFRLFGVINRSRSTMIWWSWISGRLVMFSRKDPYKLEERYWASCSIGVRARTQLKGIAFSILNHNSSSRYSTLQLYKIHCESFPPEVAALGNGKIIRQNEVTLLRRYEKSPTHGRIIRVRRNPRIPRSWNDNPANDLWKILSTPITQHTACFSLPLQSET